MARKHPPLQGGVAGVVKRFDADKGWGVIVALEVPGDCFVHYSSIQASGYRELRAGQRVCFTYEEPGFLQDGCRFRVLQVWSQSLTARPRTERGMSRMLSGRTSGSAVAW